MSNPNDTLLNAVLELNKSETMPLQTVEKILGLELKVDAEKSNDSFAFFTGRPTGSLVAIKSADYRVPKNRTKVSGEFLSISLSTQSTLDRAFLIGKLGQPDDISVPTPSASALYSAVYKYRLEGRLVKFAIGPGPDEKIVSVILDRTE